ncbi:probable ATP-dependent RNA helicase ddx31 [Xenia sp. Carnegie-2017]|uniref:probable ATP-dependent RNA helicase ddx31 n=1 Tax=Xenia sp. Carnegie-2017 TaxID=2897299 RepID=UPI001F048DFB|nr:probable ATP-dependent RNA helicase ddx31 [Xenia sp. Carnegie-2017]
MAKEDDIILNLTGKSSFGCDRDENFGKRKSQQRHSTKKAKHMKKSIINEIENKNTVQQVIRGKSNKFQIISSVFEKNPTIPNISRDVVQSLDNKIDDTFSKSDFRQLMLAPLMIINLERNLKLTKMTSVQKASIPLLLKGKDVFVRSPTGSGKTLSYIVPVVQSLQAIMPKIKRTDGTYCLILVPTRELATQTLTVLKKVLKPFIWIVPGSITGGEKRKSEKARLRKGINILVATPGRLADHLKTTSCLKLSQIRWLILDEADRLLDLGFEEDISFILSTVKEHTSSKRYQKVLLSATLEHHAVHGLVGMNMESPITINICNQNGSKHEEEYDIPMGLEQFCVVVPLKLRLVTLSTFLEQKLKKSKCKIIVFFTTQDSVEFHFVLFANILSTSKDLAGNGTFMKLHGNLPQHERVEVFQSFKDSEYGVLLCTDVVARGLDMPSVDWIVQYNPPILSADYVHRVGRTARIGNSGHALLFLLPSEVAYLKLLNSQNLRLRELKMDEIHEGFRSLYPAETGSIQNMITEVQMKFEEFVVDNTSTKQKAVTAFRSFIGAYNTFPSSLKHIFHPRNLHLGHLAKSFALRETPSELKRTFASFKVCRKKKESQQVVHSSKRNFKQKQRESGIK